MHRDPWAVLTSSAMDLLGDLGPSPGGSAASKGLAGEWGMAPLVGPTPPALARRISRLSLGLDEAQESEATRLCPQLPADQKGALRMSFLLQRHIQECQEGEGLTHMVFFLERPHSMGDDPRTHSPEGSSEVWRVSPAQALSRCQVGGLHHPMEVPKPLRRASVSKGRN